MNFMANFLLSSAVLLLVAAFSAVPDYSQKVITVAVVGEADTFDPMVSTKDIVSQVTQHFVETLYTFYSGCNIAPLLATDLPVISGDGMTYTIGIREGVTFHDGSSMDANDVVASLNRWLEVATRGKGVADKVSSVEATGEYEVTITMNEPYSPLLSLLAFSNSAAAVYPEEIIDGELIGNVVGTGPYMIAEHMPDQYLQLVRFDGYSSRTEPSNGAAGARNQVPE